MVRAVSKVITKDKAELKNVETDLPSWTFFTNHTHVLIVLSTNPGITLREVAHVVGITERAVQNIVAELAEASYLEIIKHGRKNEYRLQLKKPLRHPIEKHRTVKEVIELITKT